MTGKKIGIGLFTLLLGVLTVICLRISPVPEKVPELPLKIWIQREEKQAKPCIGYLPQNLVPYHDMTPLEYLLFVADAKKLPYNRTTRQIHELLDLMGFKDEKKRLIGFLSKGQQRCLAIAQTMLGKAEILFLDDPYDGLGSNDSQVVHTLIDYIAKKKTIIISSSRLSDLKQNCQEILILSQGKIIDIKDPFNSTLDAFLSSLPQEASLEKDNKKQKEKSRTLSILTQKQMEYEVIDEKEEEDKK